MTDHINTAQERAKLEGLAGHTPGPWDAHGLTVYDTCMDGVASCHTNADARLIAAAPELLATIHRLLDALDAERARAEKAEAMLDHTQQWYAERVRKIEDVAKREGLWPEIAAILANGSATRQIPDGSFLYDPPTYAQQLNIAKHRAEKVEAERDQALARLAGVCTDRDALAGAAYETCATAASIADHAAGEPETEFDRGYDQACRDNADAIRNLTPADAEAALQRVVDATWNEAMEASAWSFDDDTTAQQARQTILTLKRPEDDQNGDL